MGMQCSGYGCLRGCQLVEHAGHAAGGRQMLTVSIHSAEGPVTGLDARLHGGIGPLQHTARRAADAGWQDVLRKRWWGSRLAGGGVDRSG